MFPPSTRILIVDDMKTMRRLLCKQFQDLGYQNLVEAEDGDIAWKLLEKSHAEGQAFGLVVSDWNMPKMKGIDLLRKLRSDARTKDTAFLMVTAEVEAKSLNEAKAADTRASGFLNKPFRLEDLQKELKQAFTTFKKAA